MKENTYCVYMHKNKKDDKKYIGITKRGINTRWGKDGKGYGWTYKSHPTYSTHFSNAIKKYGWDTFEHIILYESLTKEEACKKERELISYYKTNEPEYGYNQTLGGQCGSAGLQWFTNGVDNYYGNKCPENMRKGRTLNLDANSREKLRTASGKKWYTDGINEVFLRSDEPIPFGYVRGRKKGIGRNNTNKAHNKGKHRYTDGNIFIYADTCPEGFKKSMLDFNRKRKRVTNGEKHRFIFEDEIESFLKSNKDWYLYTKKKNLKILS